MKNTKYSNHQTHLPVDIQILNIAMNMVRISQLAEKSHSTRQALIKRFLDQTESYLSDLPEDAVSKQFQPFLIKFKKKFPKLKSQIINTHKTLWVEKALTWANIFEHRAKLALR